jgi:fumarylacetoacetase
MSGELNRTHDPHARSWVQSANDGATDFPIQNLPLGVFDAGGEAHIGVAIGDQILDLHAAVADDLLAELDAKTRDALKQPALNELMALGADAAAKLRAIVFHLLLEGSSAQSACEKHLRPQSDTKMLMPAAIGDYTDFYASIFHATNVGSMFRPDNPLLPNYKWVPIGYHGRASSIVASGAEVPRPSGQTKADDAAAPVFGPTRRLDYELEVGVFIGQGNHLGSNIPIEQVNRHAFGLCLVNDWSARDVQAWEYQPLGPFLAKNFMTTISPWIVTMEALAPFRAPAFRRDQNDPAPLPYLLDESDQRSGGLDLTLEVWLQSEKMRAANMAPQRLSQGNFRDMYWTLAQMIAHHASNGCNLRPGDLLASGTVSGPAKDSRGCMLELAWRGTEPITLASGEQRKFLEDGDEIILRGFCQREGAARIGFGECRGTVRAGV